MSKERSFAQLLEMIENNRKEWLQNAPVASGVTVVRHTESLSVRLSKEETDALEKAAVGLGITKSTLLRIIIREYLGLNRGFQVATTSRSQLVGREGKRTGKSVAKTATKVLRDALYSDAAKSAGGGATRQRSKKSKT